MAATKMQTKNNNIVILIHCRLKSIQCENACHRYFHQECVKLSTLNTQNMPILELIKEINGYVGGMIVWWRTLSHTI